MGRVPREQLVNSIAPFQDGAAAMWGPWLACVVSLGAIISSAERMDPADGAGGYGGGARPVVAAIYNLIVGLSTMAAVIPYAFCALAGGLIGARMGAPPYRIGSVEVIAFVFAVFTLYGCGATTVLCGLMLLILGIPVYVWQQRRQWE